MTSVHRHGKHIVFLACDYEYRSEETCPAHARSLAKQLDLKCTVIFGKDKNDYIEAGLCHFSGLGAVKDFIKCL
jgi:hypothetical protein